MTGGLYRHWGIINSWIVPAVLTRLLQSLPVICTPCPSAAVMANYLLGPSHLPELPRRLRHLRHLKSPQFCPRLWSGPTPRYPSNLGALSCTAIRAVQIQSQTEWTLGNTAATSGRLIFHWVPPDISLILLADIELLLHVLISTTRSQGRAVYYTYLYRLAALWGNSFHSWCWCLLISVFSARRSPGWARRKLLPRTQDMTGWQNIIRAHSWIPRAAVISKNTELHDLSQVLPWGGR